MVYAPVTGGMPVWEILYTVVDRAVAMPGAPAAGCPGWEGYQDTLRTHSEYEIQMMLQLIVTGDAWQNA